METVEQINMKNNSTINKNLNHSGATQTLDLHIKIFSTYINSTTFTTVTQYKFRY